MSDRTVPTRTISLESALRLLERVRAEAGERSLNVAASVVDPGGHVVASARMDGTPLGALVLAVDKAYTAVLWGAPTGEFMQSTQPGGADWGFTSTSGGRIVVYAGGLPITEDGALVGALGVSGGTAEQDEECARAALTAEGFDT